LQVWDFRLRNPICVSKKSRREIIGTDVGDGHRYRVEGPERKLESGLCLCPSTDQLGDLGQFT
jgi:hypothetical protein